MSKETTMSKYTPQLWILGGVLLMLPSIFGNDRSELIPIGIVFIVVGITTKARSKDSNAE